MAEVLVTVPEGSPALSDDGTYTTPHAGLQDATVASSDVGSAFHSEQLLPNPSIRQRSQWTKRHLLVLLMMLALLALGVVVVVWTTYFDKTEHSGSSVKPDEVYTNPTLDNFVLNGSALQPQTMGGQWTGNTLYILQDESIYAIGRDTGKQLVASPETLMFQGQQLSVFDFRVSPDARRIILFTNRQSGWRHSFLAEYYLLDTQTANITWLTGHQEFLQYVSWSPDTTEPNVAIVRARNVYIVNVASGEEKALTSSTETVFNGIPSWSYEEEVLESNSALYWSSDGKRLAFGSYDVKDVEEYSIPLYQGQPYPDMNTYNYPAAGFANPVATVSVYSLDDEQLASVDLSQDGLDAETRYVYQVLWANPDLLAVRTVNRHQNVSTLMTVDLNGQAAGTAVLAQVTLVQSSTAWVEVVDMPEFVEVDSVLHFLDLTVASNGYRHIALYEFGVPSTLVGWVTSGEWEVTSIDAVSSDSSVFFTCTKDGPTERTVYRASLRSSAEPGRVTPRGWSVVSFSPTVELYWLQYMGPRIPYTGMWDVYTGNNVALLIDNADRAAQLEQYSLPTVEFTTFESADASVMLNGYMMVPPGVSLNTTTAQMPVLVYVYGGPGSQTVTQRYKASGTLNRWHMFLASRGFLIVSVDGRGTGARGATFLHANYLELGGKEVLDQLAVVEQLAARSYVDEKHIGIWGWSFGGYMTCKTLTTASQLIASGMAVAPVTDWRFYDSIYTERYMSTPDANPIGYTLSSVLDFASNIKDNQLLLVHGTGDDNVHYLNSMELVKRLVSNQVLFQFMAYPNQQHGISSHGAQDHIWRVLTSHVARTLSSTADQRSQLEDSITTRES